MTERLFATHEVMRLSGAKEGQIHRWVHAGLVPSAVPSAGCGHPRKYDLGGVFAAAVLHELALAAEHHVPSGVAMVRSAARSLPSLDEARGRVLVRGREGPWELVPLEDVPGWMARETTAVVVAFDGIVDRLEAA